MLKKPIFAKMHLCEKRPKRHQNQDNSVIIKNRGSCDPLQQDLRLVKCAKMAKIDYFVVFMADNTFMRQM